MNEDLYGVKKSNGIENFANEDEILQNEPKASWIKARVAEFSLHVLDLWDNGKH